MKALLHFWREQWLVEPVNVHHHHILAKFDVSHTQMSISYHYPTWHARQFSVIVLRVAARHRALPLNREPWKLSLVLQTSLLKRKAETDGSHNPEEVCFNFVAID